MFDNLYLMFEMLETLRQQYGPVSGLHNLLFPYFLYPFRSIMLMASIYTTILVALER